MLRLILRVGVCGQQPTFALGTFALLVLQSEAMMEPRYREPVDSIPVCAALVMTHRKKAEQPLDIRTHG